MRRLRRAPILALCILTAGCVSFWEQRWHQEVEWSDGSDATLEVWVAQGTAFFDHPWIVVVDTLATPIVWFAEGTFALAAATSDDAAIAWGPLGFLASLLPVYTCMPLDAKPLAWLRLHDRLPVPAAERDVLRGLSNQGSVEWLATRCESAWGKESPHLADNVRRWVTAVRVGPPKGDAAR
jgi:hypothetical protein